jgi:hypothetical protein
MCNIEQRIMKDLVEFKNAQIGALQQELAKSRERNIQLETWVFELCDRDCPDEYKEVIINEFNKLD